MSLGQTLPPGGSAAHPAEPESFPRQFGDYELLELIGRGAMGVVYKARQVSLKRLVALKMISAGALVSPMLVHRFKLEAEAAASLQHPHIVSIYEIGEHDDQPFFSMELIEGQGLNHCIYAEGFRREPSVSAQKEDARQRQMDTARFIAKVAAAVDYAHKHGVLHRDIKPANILLDAQGEPHLTDFGLAKMLQQEGEAVTLTGAILGTPSYMAPEQAAGQTKLVSIAADIYSLGAVLYKMLTGHPPFHADTPFETIQKVVNEEPKHPSSLNGEIDYDLATICLKCLEKNPQERYASAGALGQDLERWMRREPIEARPISHLEKVCRWCHREPVLAAMTAAMVLLLLATTATVSWFFWRQASEAQDRSERSRRTVLRQLYEAWEDTNQFRVRINAEELDLILRRPMPHSKVAPTRLNFGFHTSFPEVNTPEKNSEHYARILNYLETNNAAVPLRIDIHIFKNPAHLAEAVANGSVHLARLSPSAYVSARKAGVGVTILAQQLHSGGTQIHGAFFTHTDSSIQSLADVKGGTLGFAQSGHPFGDRVPKAMLYALGFRAEDFRSSSNLPVPSLLRMVSEKRLDAAAVQIEQLEDAIRAGAPLRKLTNLTSLTFPWVGGSQLDPNLAGVLQQSLITLTNTLILLPVEANFTGFGQAKPGDYVEVEEQMTNAMHFDERQAQPPAKQ